MRKLIVVFVLLFILTGCTTSSLLFDLFYTLPPSAPALPPVGDAERGAEIFTHGVPPAPPCSTCHKVETGAYGFSLGPNLAGIAGQAATRIPEVTAEEYIRESILDPHAYLVPGYRPIMYAYFGDYLNDQDIADLIAYLMTLTAP